MKKERAFLSVIGDVIIGSPCIIKLTTGEIAKTSPVVNYFHSANGDWKIETRNTIYRCYV